ncbi:MAG: hypothetical protein FWE03_07155 [Firmicutes bacterium]|nr:hypothetical protein [Bacillota bacterium]
MKKTKQIRNMLLLHLKNEQDFKDAIIAEIDGCNFSAADIALTENSDKCHVYRLTIIKHG